MRYKSRKRSKRIVIIFVLVGFIVIVTFGAFIIFRNNNGDEDKEKPAISGNSSSTTVTSSDGKPATIFDAIESYNDYQAFIKDQTRKTEVVRITEIVTDGIDWNTQKVVPVKFFASSGQSIQSVIVDDNGLITVTILDAPGGCVYPAIQNKHLGFAIVANDKEVSSQTSVKIETIKNDAMCQQN
ncbi:hypothetical protein KDA00_00870 [Candidatus Saccharibacteria bacterium]|nr:hypothetical protein [Candidatus Saccharibacteria bacterium]